MRLNGESWQRLAAALGLSLILSLPAVVWGASPELRISPDQVGIGAFFTGQTLTVEGKIPAGSQAVMEIIGTTADEHLMRKGRRAGLWMNVGEIDIHDAPSLYMVMSTETKLLSAAGPEVPWGFAALKKRVSLSGMVKDQEKEKFLQQFLKLKESEGLYATLKDPMSKAEAAGGLIPVKGEFRLPTNLRPGTYKVCLSVIQNGQVAGKTCSEVKVMLVGFPALLSTLAYEHGTTYGIVAVIIAIVTGFAMGFLFKGGGGH
jgi:Putative transmembrane protein (Alph_Pro_TM)